MEPPSLPKLEELSYITPSIYAATLLCPARGLWAASKNQPRLPEHPSSLLGVAFHSLVEHASKGGFAGISDDFADCARSYFDAVCGELYDDAHPLIRAKFSSPNRMPNYYLFRERAVIAAAEVRRPFASNVNAVREAPSLAEQPLSTKDGLLRGRPDLLDVKRKEIVDYKSGLRADAGISTEEARQLLLYGEMAEENSFQIERGIVVRPDGRRFPIAMSSGDMQAEAAAAKEVLRKVNAAISGGASFAELANPSPTNCWMCPCMPSCDRFWQTADQSWAESLGAQIEGVVSQVERSSIQGADLVSINLDVSRGTIGPGDCSVEQIPAAWLVVGGSPLPSVGGTVRVTNCRFIDSELRVARVDRIVTCLWTIDAKSDGAI